MLILQVLLLVHYYAVETYLCEIALDDNIEPSRYGHFSLSRLDLLFGCLESTRKFFETFYTLPGTVAFDLPYPIWALVSHLNVVLSQLSLCTVEGWDHNYVSKTLDFYTILDKLSAQVEEAKQMVFRAPDEGTATSSTALPRSVPLIFLTVASKVRNIRAVHEARKADQVRRCQLEVPPSDLAVEIPELPDNFNLPGYVRVV